MKNRLKCMMPALLLAGLVLAPLQTLRASSLFTLYSENIPTGAVSQHTGQTTGWGIEITTSTYYLIVTSVQSTYAQYPGGLSIDPSTPVEDYLSYFFATNSTTVSPGNPFEQETFIEGTPGDTGVGLGAFHIRSDAATSTEFGDILINYVLFDADPYGLGPANQVDENGNFSSAEIVATLSSSVHATAAVPEPGAGLLGAFGLAVLYAVRRSRAPKA